MTRATTTIPFSKIRFIDKAPRLSDLTERLTQKLRQIRKELPGLRFDPLVLVGFPEIGKSFWARRLAHHLAVVHSRSMREVDRGLFRVAAPSGRGAHLEFQGIKLGPVAKELPCVRNGRGQNSQRAANPEQRVHIPFEHIEAAHVSLADLDLVLQRVRLGDVFLVSRRHESAQREDHLAGTDLFLRQGEFGRCVCGSLEWRVSALVPFCRSLSGPAYPPDRWFA